MEIIPSNPVLEFNANQLQEVRTINVYEDAKQMNQAIDAFEDWIKKQNHFAVKQYDRGYLERMIITNKGSIERAKQRLDRICTLRNLMPEFMCNIDILNDFNNLHKILQIGVLPKPTKDNYRITYESFIKSDESYNVTDTFKYTYLMFQYSLCNDYYAGIECIVDLREYSFSMLSTISFTDFHKGITMLLQTFGSRCRSIHIISSNKILDGVMLLFRKCLSDKMNKRIHIHHSHDTLSQFFDKSVLPVEIGGEYKKSLKEICDEYFKELCSESNLARMKDFDAAVTIESQRIKASFNEEYSGMPGSFKSLCVD
ncbi:uncharacterized protein LOC125236368 [Leguminivora glycinivorella]|uniref:uncharacterized protein LOC125236368 n=1 Tax=Leguminivora glycinivorella TaxID=1035111 RepID=UPI00200D43C7|nr:uncharacterized protein LOC125236368 [Leguminivora glycinivorella]